MPTLRRAALTLTAAAALLALTQSPANAHISPSPSSAPAGSYFLFQLVVPHGCEDASTTKVEVQIPKSIESVTPQTVAGWTITRGIEPLDPPVDDGEGGTISERTATITWDGGPLAHDELEQFGLSVKLPDTPGESLSFPVIQTCGTEELPWIEVPVEGEEEPERPAPTITLTESTGDGHGGSGDDEAEEEPEGESVGAETTAATDSGDDDTDPMAVAGVVLGAAGLGVGGFALSRSRRTPTA